MKRKNKHKKYDRILKQCGKAFFKLRLEHTLTIKQAAKKLGITEARLGKIEKGEYDFTVDLLFRMGRLYGFHPRDFAEDNMTIKPTKNKKK